MSGYATTLISALVLIVAFMQWRTAHQKVVLDLFERRLALIEAAREAAKLVVIENGGDFVPAHKIAVDAAIRSRFLFGPEIVKLLVEFQGDVYRATEFGSITEITSDKERIEIAKTSARRLLSDINTMAERYLRMDQKIVRTPHQWFHDRNQIRLSYGDHHQR